MRHRRNSISVSEKARRAQQRARSLNDVEQLLYRRRQTARVLGEISIATIQRLEKAGKLTKVRLAGRPTAWFFTVPQKSTHSPRVAKVTPRRARVRTPQLPI